MPDPKEDTAAPQLTQGNSTVKVIALVIPALLALVFMLRAPIEKMLSNEGPGSDAPASVQNADAFRKCVSEVLVKKSQSTDKGKLEIGELKTDQDRQTAIENADLTPEERKSVLDGCKSMFPDGATKEMNAHLTLVEGEHDDPVARDVRVAIEAGSRYVEPGQNGEAVVPYFPVSCGRTGCAVTIERSSAYELASPSPYDKEALAHGVTVKLRRKNQGLVIALGSRANTPHVWIQGTNEGAQLWNPACQPNDTEVRCRRVQAEDGSARLNARGSLTSLTIRLSANGDDWTAPPIEIADVAGNTRNGVLALPEPEHAANTAAAAPCATSDAQWFSNRVRAFSGWKKTRTLTVTAALTSTGVTKLAASPPFTSDDERDALAQALGKPAGMKAGCKTADLSTANIHARVQ